MSLIEGFATKGTESATHQVFNVVTDSITRLINEKTPVGSPDLPTLIEIWQKGWLNDESFNYLCRREGYFFKNATDKFQDWYVLNQDKSVGLDKEALGEKSIINKNWLQSMAWIPPIELITEWINKGFIDEETAQVWLRMHGIVSPKIRDTWLKQRNEWPTVQDLIQFSVRHGFEPDILNTFGYNKEIPSGYLNWAKQIGLGGSSKVTVPNSTDENQQPVPDHEATWAEQHWFAHWILPSLGDAYEMLHRLYPKSDFGPSPDWKAGLDFTPELLSLFQRAQDIPAYWRERLQSISYLPFSRVDVRRMFNSGIIEREEVYHSYRAQGYTDDKSKKLLKYAEKAKQDQIVKEELWPQAKPICELYKVGILSDNDVKTYTDKLGIPLDDTKNFIANCKLEKKKNQIDAIIKAMHRAFLKGIINDGEVKDQLEKLQIQKDAIDDLVNLWTIEKLFEFKEDNAAEAQKWYVQGIISSTELVARLQNLNINDSSILRMVQSSDVTISEKVAKELQQRAKEIEVAAKQKAAAQKAAAKEQEKEQKDIIKRMLASSTQVNLKKWYKEGLISDTEVSTRLAALDYDPDDIQRWLVAYGG